MRTRVDGFRVSLLGVLGLLPWVACGGATEETPKSTGGGGNAAAGSSQGGKLARGGAGMAGATFAGKGGDAGQGGDAGEAGAGASAPTGGTSENGGAGGRIGPFPCEGEAKTDISKSFVYCEGFKHRTRKAVCRSSLPREAPVPPQGAGGVGSGECTSDAECTEHEHGYCGPFARAEETPPGNYCQYGCVEDDDCSPGFLCDCGDPGDIIGHCVRATCFEDSECGTGLLCASYVADPGCDFPAYACQSEQDRCATDEHCAPDEHCTVNEAGVRVCTLPLCQIGRPFLVAGEERGAPTVARADWRGTSTAPDVTGLGARVREQLADAWGQVGRMEHASIAAFARFALELLAYGAPAELLAETSRAMADETRHAELAYALASGYAGSSVGPGALAVQGCLERVELDASVVTAFVEGCIGETVAAVEAREALSVARDPAVRSVLAEVTRDETRHAELAWRFLRWALPSLRVDTLSRLKQELASALAECPVTEGSARAASEPALAEHGVLDPALRWEVRRAVLEHVVAPCFERLLEAHAGDALVPESGSCPPEGASDALRGARFFGRSLNGSAP